MIHKRILGAAGLAAALAAPAYAADFELPGQLAMTAYGTGSSGYNQMVAVGAALQNATGTNLRVLPGKNDIARMEPLRQGKIDISAMGVGTYMVQEGVFEFASKRWGPQDVRIMMTNNAGTAALAVGVAGDIGVETYADLEGKRVSRVRGAPALNVAMEAYLAYGGLTWDDVEVVEFGGYGASWEGMINDQVDAAFAIMTSGQAFQMEASPRGLVWPPIDPENAEGLERMQSIAPYFAPTTATEGAVAASTEGGLPSAAYPYPLLATYADRDPDLIYNFTKAMYELYDQYEGKAPGVNGWALEHQDFQWVVPYHEAAIRYYEEIGEWSEEAQQHNDMLIERQKILSDAWAELEEQDPENWEEAWAEHRRQALKDAGMPVVF